MSAEPNLYRNFHTAEPAPHGRVTVTVNTRGKVAHQSDISRRSAIDFAVSLISAATASDWDESDES